MNTLVLRIAWRNIWRNSRRTGITLATMIITVGLNVWLITFADGMYEEMIRQSVTLGLGSLQVHAEGYQEDKAVEKAVLDPAPVVEIVRNAPGVKGVSTRLNAFGLISHGSASQGSAIIGVEPAGETTISVIDKKVIEGEWLPETIENERRPPIVIGSGMAQKLGVGIGDRLFLTIQGFTGDVGYAVYFVHGIFTTGMGEMDKAVGYVPINTLRSVMAADVSDFQNAVHEVTALMGTNADVDAAVAFIRRDIGSQGLQAGNRRALEAMSWEEIQPGLKAFIEFDKASLFVMVAVFFIIVSAGVMNSFLMSVFERIREFGILMSLGTRPSGIFRLVMIESLIVGTIGALGGLGAGLLAFWINTLYPFNYGAMQDMSAVMSMNLDFNIYPHLVWPDVVIVLVGIVIMTGLAALWPAIKASLLKPVEAMRHV
jgi:putative ABC transport system permease protein